MTSQDKESLIPITRVVATKSLPLAERSVKDRFSELLELMNAPNVYRGKTNGRNILAKAFLRNIYEKDGKEGIVDLARWLDAQPGNYFINLAISPSPLPVNLQVALDKTIASWNAGNAYPEQSLFRRRAFLTDRIENTKERLALAAATLVGGTAGYIVGRNSQDEKKSHSKTTAAIGAVTGYSTAKSLTNRSKEMRYHKPVNWVNIDYPVDAIAVLKSADGFMDDFKESGFITSEARAV